MTDHGRPAARRRVALFACLVAAGAVFAGGTGCKRKFEPGVYLLTGVFQVTKDAEGEETSRSELRVVGTARYVFDYDGQFLVEYDGYGVGFERACSGSYRGMYSLLERQVELAAAKMRLPAYCRPEKKRSYTWDRGWGGTITLERHWEDNQYIVYRLEPEK